MRWFIASLFVVSGVVGCGKDPGSDKISGSAPTTTAVVTTTTQARPTTTVAPTTTTTLPDLSGVDFVALARSVWGKCGEWRSLALSLGWPESEWPTLNKVMWRESRCQPTALNGRDPNGGSSGLLQINHYWCRPSRYTPNGWLQDQGVLKECADLFDPTTNLRAGIKIFTYSLNKNSNGWNPWTTAS